MRPDAAAPASPTSRRRMPAWWALLTATALLAGCDMLGIDTPAKQAERREADGKAIGAGCRHTQRSLEDCYAANPKASKAAIFAGWREMDEYMRENDIPALPPASPPSKAADAAPDEEVVTPAPKASADPNTKPAATAAPTTPPTGSIVPRIAPPAANGASR
ncbi:hypothetical protein [Tepidimonas thermarum]